MTGKSSRTWLYAFLLVGMLVVLRFLPGALRKRNYLYQTSSSDKGVTINQIPMDREFTRLAANGAASKVRLSDLAKERPGGLLVNFWATWCPPCLEEMPSLENLSRQLANQKDSKLPLLVTISVDEQANDVISLFKTLSFRPTLPVLHDPGAVFSAGLGTTKFPETYWVAPDGKILFKWLGPQDWLSEPILRRLASPSHTPVLK